MLFFFRYVGLKIGLVDKPNERKQHLGFIPLIGGISIFITITFSFLIFLPLNLNLFVYLSCSFVLIFIGILDDLYDLSFYWRLLVQIVLTLFVFYSVSMSLDNLGNLLGDGDVRLNEFFSIIISILAVLGSINAFNMVDGIDGLLGILTTVTLGAVSLLFFHGNQEVLGSMCLMLIVAIFPYILMNLGMFGNSKKVFMGDAGSMFIGFTVVWLLIHGTQKGSASAFNSVTVLWFIAVPLMDMAAVMIRRIRDGSSPFKPDRGHLHHLFIKMGFSQHQTLFIISALSMIFAIIGVWSDFSKVKESTMFVAFLVLFCLYLIATEYFFKLFNSRICVVNKTKSDINIRKEHN